MSDTIRVSFMDEYPYLNSNCSNPPHNRVGLTCNYPGMSVEIVNLLARYLNLNIHVVKISPRTPSWTNVFDEVYNNETDVYGMFVGEHTPKYTRKFEFTKPIYWNAIRVVVKKRDNAFKSIFAFFQMYNFEMWLSLIAVFILFTIFGTIVHKVEYRLKLRERYSIAGTLWMMTRVQLTNSNVINYKLLAGRVATLFYLIFQISIIFKVYENLILTRIIKKSETSAFVGSRFAQLIKAKTFTVVLDKKEMNWILEDIYHNIDIPFYEIREALQVNPYKLVDNVMETLNNERGTVSFFSKTEWLITKANDNCDLTLVDVNIKPRPQRFMFKMGSRFVSMFNEAIHTNRYMIGKIVRKYLKYQPAFKCNTQNDRRPLTIKPFYGLMLMFMVGNTVACVVFVRESMRKKRMNSDRVG